MRISESAVLNQNITLVYDSLDPKAIDSALLKTVVDSAAPPLIMDTPELIVAVYPAESIVVQIGDRRIRVTLTKLSTDLADKPLSQLAVKCSEMARKWKLIAYGFNYDLEVHLEDADSRALMLELCISDFQRLEHILGGQLVSFTPRLQYKRDQVQYDLVIEPIDSQSLTVHFNVHFEHSNLELPSAGRLEGAFREQFGYLTSVLPGLLEGGKW